MRLARPFYRLPLRIDARLLAAEIRALPEDAWLRHPTGFAGNTAVPLVTVGGEVNDDFAAAGGMAPTPLLAQLPYTRSVMAALSTPISRSRLMRLAPGAEVPWHTDANFHWYRRTRIHVPVVTNPDVLFHSEESAVHMAAGEVWTFDNFKLHRVTNPSPVHRIHLVIDTPPSSPLLALLATDGGPEVSVPPSDRAPVFERASADHLGRGEVAALIGEARDGALEILPDDAARRTFVRVLERFAAEWAALDGEAGPEHDALLDLLDRSLPPAFLSRYAASRPGRRALTVVRTQRTRSNTAVPTSRPDLDATTRLFPRRDAVLGFDRTGRTCARLPASGSPVLPLTPEHLAVLARAEGGIRPEALEPPLRAALGDLAREGLLFPIDDRLVDPLFIVGCPRSGSTLLFETLARAPGVFTIGGEGHGVIEQLPSVRPGVGPWTNRLTEVDATEAVSAQITAELVFQARDREGRRLLARPRPVRFLEKTPKNALRIPFLRAIFPEARFLYLHRDPRENISSILEAWRSGRFVTYPKLPGWRGPSWSLVLPSGWEALRDAPLEQIAAFQWASVNQQICADLATLPAERWSAVSYRALCADTAATVERILTWLDWPADRSLRQTLGRPLPPSRHTLTPARREKWRANEAEIVSVLPSVAAAIADRDRLLGPGGR